MLTTYLSAQVDSDISGRGVFDLQDTRESSFALGTERMLKQKEFRGLTNAAVEVEKQGRRTRFGSRIVASRSSAIATLAATATMLHRTHTNKIHKNIQHALYTTITVMSKSGQEKWRDCGKWLEV